MNREIIDDLLTHGLVSTLSAHITDLPYVDIFNLVNTDKVFVTHIDAVIANMNKLLEGSIDAVVDLPPEDRAKLAKIIASIPKDEKVFLLFTALYHDIGKAINKPRHGAVGADLILRSKGPIRRQFYAIGFTRRQIYLLSNLIRFHDYLAGVGTGEISYLAFAEVLYPVSNMCLVDEESRRVFFNYLLLTNLADVAGSLRKQVDIATSMAIMSDFEIITRAHENISRKVSAECGELEGNMSSTAYNVHMKCMVERNLGHIMPELRRIAEDNTIERVRRLLRTGFLRAIQSLSNLDEYKQWVLDDYAKGNNTPKKVDNWFMKDYLYNDVMPIVASLNAINVKNDFYEQLAFICKLDYELSFVKTLIRSMVEDEQLKPPNLRKGPHNFRRDLAMTLVVFLNTLVDLFGCFTKNNTRIGMGFERMEFQDTPYKKELLRRLSGDEGVFKQTEVMTAFKHSVNVWII